MNSPLHDQLAIIERELATLDFDAAHERVRQAEAEFARLGGAKLQESASRPTPPPGNALNDEQLRAAGQLKQARATLDRMDSRAAELRRESERITQLLNAGAQIQEGQAAVQRAQETAAASAAALADAEAACDRLVGAVEAEKGEAAAAVEAAAASMLQAARTGASAAAVEVRPDKLAPLQAALLAAKAERDTAKARHATNLAAVGAAQRRVREAEADVSTGEFMAAEAAFIALAAQHVSVLTRAGRGAPAFVNLHERILAAAQRNDERAAIDAAVNVAVEPLKARIDDLHAAVAETAAP
jgi:DNA repair exonuclease SbcCD ATPase subunit